VRPAEQPLHTTIGVTAQTAVEGHPSPPALQEHASGINGTFDNVVAAPEPAVGLARRSVAARQFTMNGAEYNDESGQDPV